MCDSSLPHTQLRGEAGGGLCSSVRRYRGSEGGGSSVALSLLLWSLRSCPLRASCYSKFVKLSSDCQRRSETKKWWTESFKQTSEKTEKFDWSGFNFLDYSARSSSLSLSVGETVSGLNRDSVRRLLKHARLDLLYTHILRQSASDGGAKKREAVVTACTQ